MTGGGGEGPEGVDAHPRSPSWARKGGPFPPGRTASRGFPCRRVRRLAEDAGGDGPACGGTGPAGGRARQPVGWRSSRASGPNQRRAPAVLLQPAGPPQVAGVVEHQLAPLLGGGGLRVVDPEAAFRFRRRRVAGDPPHGVPEEIHPAQAVGRRRGGGVPGQARNSASSAPSSRPFSRSSMAVWPVSRISRADVRSLLKPDGRGSVPEPLPARCGRKSTDPPKSRYPRPLSKYQVRKT